MTKVGHWFNINYDYVTGGGFGVTTGLITIPHYISSALYSIIVALCTGFAGALGAHILRKIIEKLKPKK
jgi:hypothetical protein